LFYLRKQYANLFMLSKVQSTCRGGFRDSIDGETDNLSTKPALMKLTKQRPNSNYWDSPGEFSGARLGMGARLCAPTNGF